jgi:signal transduction histidine kinase
MSQELQMVESNERRRLSRELHDEVGQLLTSLKFDLASVKRSVAGRSKTVGSRGQERLARALDTTDLLFTRLRQIVRALRPPGLEELGLKSGLEHCSMVFEQEERCAARVPTLETAFYRIVQELLTNVIRHARATSVSIAMKSSLREWQLTVKDDGIGFDVAGLSPAGGFGLRGIRERVEILAGQVEIVSSPGTGTSVHVLIPVSREPEGSQGSDTQAASPRRRRRKVVHE